MTWLILPSGIQASNDPLLAARSAAYASSYLRRAGEVSPLHSAPRVEAMNAQPRFFAPLARVLHWLMALMIIAMLFIGAGLAASVSERYEWLIHLHKPLGIAILGIGDCAPGGAFLDAPAAVASGFAGGRGWQPRPPMCCCTR